MGSLEAGRWLDEPLFEAAEMFPQARRARETGGTLLAGQVVQLVGDMRPSREQAAALVQAAGGQVRGGGCPRGAALHCA